MQLGIHSHLPLGDDVELTFLSFDEQMVLKQALKDLADMLDVLCLILRENEYIVKVDKDKSAQLISQHVIYQTLKYCWCVG